MPSLTKKSHVPREYQAPSIAVVWITCTIVLQTQNVIFNQITNFFLRICRTQPGGGWFFCKSRSSGVQAHNCVNIWDLLSHKTGDMGTWEPTWWTPSSKIEKNCINKPKLCPDNMSEFTAIELLDIKNLISLVISSATLMI